MKISIALAVYNASKYLDEQLESYLKQSLLPDEIVVGDDCSSDNSLAIIEKFRQRAPFPVKIITRPKNLGVVRNFDDTIAQCSGDIIFLSDADDVWLPQKIQRLVEEFAAFPDVGLVWANAALVDENLQPLNRTLWEGRFPKSEKEKIRQGKIIEVVLRQNVVGGATSAFRAKYKQWFQPIPTDLDLLHDGWLALIVGSLTGVRFVDQELMLYRQHGQQTSRVLFQTDREKEFDRHTICEDGLALSRERLKQAERLHLKLVELRETDATQSSLLEKSVKITEQQLEEAREAIAHFQFRLALPNRRLPRIFRILRELKTRRYSQYSNGIKSATKDLLVP